MKTITLTLTLTRRDEVADCEAWTLCLAHDNADVEHEVTGDVGETAGEVFNRTLPLILHDIAVEGGAS